MIRFKLLLLLLALLTLSNSEIAQKNENAIHSNQKDQTASADEPHHYYLPYKEDKDCSPCNLEPWIPIQGHTKYPNINSSPANNGYPIREEYGPPNLEYGPPISQKPIYGPPKVEYGPPVSQNAVYGPPKPNYGPPVQKKPIYGPPKLEYGPPVPQYPPKPIYGPPRPNFTPPKPIYGPPKPIYGPPKPKPQYGPPKPIYGPPKPNYNLPKPLYIPPFENIADYMLPPPMNYKIPFQMYAPQYKPPNNDFSEYNLPQMIFEPPKYEAEPPPVVKVEPSTIFEVPSAQNNAYDGFNDVSNVHISDIPLDEGFIPPAVPSDSYGNPVGVSGGGSDLLQAPSGDFDTPGVSNVQLPPIYNHNNFKEDIQVQKSVKVADFVASIEHPVNIIQSPLVEVQVNEEGINHRNSKEEKFKLSENPIVVEDNHSASSSTNTKISNLIPEVKERVKNDVNSSIFIPTTNYNDWVPKYAPPIVSNSMIPPSASSKSTWVESTTKKPVQIIIPYTRKEYTTLVPTYTPPIPTPSVWTQYLEKKESTTAVYNIQDLIQRNIDSWTQESFSSANKSTVTSKQIPLNFISNEIPDHQSAESSINNIETNLIDSDDVTTESTTVSSSWKNAFVTVSPYTKEKVYVVTPQAYKATAPPEKAFSSAPRVINGSTNVTLTSKRFTVRIEPQNQNATTNIDDTIPLKVVYSEWPHLINNLETTTSKQTSTHPLFGLMGITEYTPPPNATVETFVGHSKVVTVVTPPSKIDHTKEN